MGWGKAFEHYIRFGSAGGKTTFSIDAPMFSGHFRQAMTRSSLGVYRPKCAEPRMYIRGFDQKVIHVR